MNDVPAKPQNLPPPTESGGADPASGQIIPANPQPQPLSTGAQPQQQFEQPPPQDSPAGTSGLPTEQSEDPRRPAEEARKELQDAIHASNEILVTAQTVKPMFADVFTLDRAKVTVARKGVFGTKMTMTSRVEDLLNITVESGMMFGVLRVASRVGNQAVTTIGPFWRNEALRIKRVTHGLIIALQKEIDLTGLSTRELRSMLERLGEDDHPHALTNEPAD